jgi:methylated-DNA-[protein]-cysteine S-methyltransferase
MYLTTYKSPVGELTLVADRGNLVGLWLTGQKYFMEGFAAGISRDDHLAVFAQVKSWLDRYFAGERPALTELPLSPVGSEFRQAVWQILRKIPYGEVLTYGEIAREIATRFGRTKMSAQAVGGAVGHNPISIIVPCHRVVGRNGSLTGYAGGVRVKERLLKFEGVNTKKLFVPITGSALGV